MNSEQTCNLGLGAKAVLPNMSFEPGLSDGLKRRLSRWKPITNAYKNAAGPLACFFDWQCVAWAEGDPVLFTTRIAADRDVGLRASLLHPDAETAQLWVRVQICAG